MRANAASTSARLSDDVTMKTLRTTSGAPTVLEHCVVPPDRTFDPRTPERVEKVAPERAGDIEPRLEHRDGLGAFDDQQEAVDPVCGAVVEETHRPVVGEADRRITRIRSLRPHDAKMGLARLDSDLPQLDEEVRHRLVGQRLAPAVEVGRPRGPEILKHGLFSFDGRARALVRGLFSGTSWQVWRSVIGHAVHSFRD